MSPTYRISIERLENGFAVEVPDMAEIKKKQANRKKDGLSPDCYIGDCCKKFAAKTEQEVIKIVRNALAGLGENEYDNAFDSAAKSAK